MQVKILILFEIQVIELQFCKKYLTHQVFKHFANLMLPTRVNDAVWFDQVQLSLFIQMLTGSVQDRDTCRRWPRPWQSKFAQQSFFVLLNWSHCRCIDKAEIIQEKTVE